MDKIKALKELIRLGEREDKALEERIRMRKLHRPVGFGPAQIGYVWRGGQERIREATKIVTREILVGLERGVI